MWGGTLTWRVPAADFGVPTTGWPRTHDTALVTDTTPRSRSRSRRRSSRTSPMRTAHRAHSRTTARRESGMCSTRTSSSAGVAGRTSFLVGGLEAARTRHGMLPMSSGACPLR